MCFHLMMSGPAGTAARMGAKIVPIIGLTTLALMITACSSTPTRTVGNPIPLVRVQTQTETHRTMDYQIEFTYTFQAGEGNAPDSIQFDGRIIPRRGLTTFSLRLHFMDEARQIIGTNILYAPGARRGAGRRTISRSIEVPDRAVSLGFSHEAREQRVRPRRL